MSPAEELAQLYGQWRALSEREAVAIGSSAWLDVAQCQSAKSRLQPRIVEVSQALDATVLDVSFRAVVEDLIQLEHRNDELLEELHLDTDEQLRECERSRRSLRQLQRLYVPPAGENWQSYS